MASAHNHPQANNG